MRLHCLVLLTPVFGGSEILPVVRRKGNLVLNSGGRMLSRRARREVDERAHSIWNRQWRGAADASAGTPLASTLVDSIHVESLDDDFDFDVVILFIKISPTTAACLKSIREHVRPKVRRIYAIVESFDVSCRYLATLDRNIYCLTLHALSGLSSVEIVQAHQELSRRGGDWFARQFAKLFVSLVDVGLSEYFAIVEPAVLFLQDIEMLHRVKAPAAIRAPTAQFSPLELVDEEVLDGPSVKATLQNKTYSPAEPVLRALIFAKSGSRTRLRDYGPTIYDLLGDWPYALAGGHAVATEWMVFSRRRVRAMLTSVFEHVGRGHAKSFYDAVLGPASRTQEPTFSVFELFAAYMMSNYPAEVQYDAATIYRYELGLEIADVATLKSRSPESVYITVRDGTTGHLDNPPLGNLISSPKEAKLVVSVWHVFHEAPWGGGNQFLAALIPALRRQKDVVKKVQVNEITNETTAVLINAHTFDGRAFGQAYERTRRGVKKPFVVGHRIDGPALVNRANTSAYRRQDKIVADMNKRYADISIHQSLFSWQAWDMTYPGILRYRPRVIIPNAADPALFKPRATCTAPHRPARLVSTCHATSLSKGADTLARLSRIINCSEFTLTFIGTQPRKYPLADRPCVTVLPPQQSAKIAASLSEQDIFIAPSRREPASNSLVEALAIGLPVVYRDEGGHPEAVGIGGVGFQTDDELIAALRTIKERYAFFASVAGQPLHRNIDEVARRYASALLGKSPGSLGKTTAFSRTLVRES